MTSKSQTLREVRKMIKLDDVDGQNRPGGAAAPIVISSQRSQRNKGVRMTKAQHHDALRTLEQVFGDRVKRDPVSGKGLGT